MASELYGVLDQYKGLKANFDSVKKSSAKLGGDPLKGIVYNITDEVEVERPRVTLKTVNSLEGELFTEIAKAVTIKNIRFDQSINLLDKLTHYEKIPVRITKLNIKVEPKDRQNMRSLSFTVSTMRPNK